MKTINYETVIQYYENKWCIIKRGIDTLVYDMAMKPHEIDNFYKDYQLYTTNSQDQYFDLPEYGGLRFRTTANSYKHWLALNISFTDQEGLTLEAMQVYINQDTQKLTVYGLFFRFCELAKTDWRQFMQDICMYIGYQPNIERLIRGDYKIDILGVSPDEFMAKLKNNNRGIEKRISTIYQKKGQLETIYLWNKSSKYAFPRVYDKNKDTIKKWKQVFYEDYLSQPTTRLEIQTGSNFTGDLSTKDRIEKVQSYIGEKNTNFTGNYYVWKRYNPNFILNTDYYLKRMETSILKAVHNGINLQVTFDSVNKKQHYQHFFTSSLRTWSIPKRVTEPLPQ